MNQVCVVTTFQREELLYLCLEAIRRESEYIPIWVFSDHGIASDELVKTCRNFDAMIEITNRHEAYGNSRNVITALHAGVVSVESHGVVHSIEDDTILHAGGQYFEWASNKVGGTDPKYAVALGRIPGDVLSTWYESPCVSWNAARLKQCLDKVPVGYIRATTREEMQRLADDAFPRSRHRYGSAEQDGFFLRCLEFFGWKSAFPQKSFASHVGWWGYNRPGGTPPTGTFEQRIAECRRILRHKQARMELFGQRITETEMGGM